MKKNTSDFKEFKSLLRGQIKEMEDSRDRIIKDRDKILYELLSKMEDLNNVYRRVEDLSAQKIEQVNASIKLHQDMLMHVGEDLRACVDQEVYNKIRNIDTALTLIKGQVNGMFSQKTKERAPVVVRSNTKVIERPEKPDLEEAKKSLFIDIHPKEEEEYVRPSGKINNRAISDGILKYLAQTGREVSGDELVGCIETMFPATKRKWSDTRKGLANLIQNHLKHEDVFEVTNKGTYKLKEELQ